jgi:hypothetical protein
MGEVEGRAVRGGLQPGQEPLDLAAPVGIEVGVEPLDDVEILAPAPSGEVPPVLGDAGKPVGNRKGKGEMGLNHGQVAHQRPPTLLERGDGPVGVGACVTRAQVGDRLRGDDVVGVGEQREQGERMVRGGGDPGVAEDAAEHRREGVLGVLQHPDRVAVPDAVGGEPGEAGVPVGQQVPLAVDDRGERELVEHHEHHRGGTADLHPGRPGQVVGGQQAGGRRHQEEEGGEHHRRPRQPVGGGAHAR